MKIIVFTLTVILLLFCLICIPSCINPDIEASSTESVISAEESEESDVSIPNISEASADDVSNVEKYVWYTQKELDEWFTEFKAAANGDYYSSDNKHIWGYASVDGAFIDEFFSGEKAKLITEFDKTFKKTPWCTGLFMDYFDISKEEYQTFFETVVLETYCKAEYGQYPELLSIYSIRYDAIFAEEYWNHPDFIRSDYVPPEIDSHYTSVPEDTEHIRMYYLIDRNLILYVGTDEFNKWLDETPDNEQNILNFISYFDITKEEYIKLYLDLFPGDFTHSNRPWPIDPDVLYGTQEMQDKVFKKHPLS